MEGRVKERMDEEHMDGRKWQKDGVKAGQWRGEGHGDEDIKGLGEAGKDGRKDGNHGWCLWTDGWGH